MATEAADADKVEEKTVKEAKAIRDREDESGAPLPVESMSTVERKGVLRYFLSEDEFMDEEEIALLKQHCQQIRNRDGIQEQGNIEDRNGGENQDAKLEEKQNGNQKENQSACLEVNDDQLDKPKENQGRDKGEKQIKKRARRVEDKYKEGDNVEKTGEVIGEEYEIVRKPLPPIKEEEDRDSVASRDGKQEKHTETKSLNSEVKTDNSALVTQKTDLQDTISNVFPMKKTQREHSVRSNSNAGAPDLEPLSTHQKIIRNPKKKKGLTDLHRIFQDLKETSARRENREPEGPPKPSFTSLIPKPFTDEDRHPIHDKHYEISREKVEASLYQFDSSFHKYCANAYAYEDTMLLQKEETRAEEEDGKMGDRDPESLSGTGGFESPSWTGEFDSPSGTGEFESPPDYPAKDGHGEEVTGDVLLLQDMLKKALGGSDGAALDTPTHANHGGDTVADGCDNARNTIVDTEKYIAKLNAKPCDSYIENDSYENIKKDVMALIEKQQTELDAIRKKLTEIDYCYEEEQLEEASEAGNEDEDEDEEEGEENEKEEEVTEDNVEKDGKDNSKSGTTGAILTAELEKLESIKTLLDAPTRTSAKNKRTKLGFTIRDCMQNFEDNSWYPTRNFGVLACDAEMYAQHADILVPYISRLHYRQPLRGYVFGLNKRSLKSIGSMDNLPNVLDCAVSITRSLSNEVFPFSYIGKHDIQRVNNILKNTVKNTDRAGTTAPLSFADKDVDDLISQGILKKTPGRQQSTGSSLYKESRENGGKLLAILNYQEHIRVISLCRSADIKSVFEDAATLLNALERKLSEQNQYFAWDDQFGYLNANPEMLGIACNLAIRASFNALENIPDVENVLRKLGMRVSGSSWNSRLKRNVHTLVNRNQFGTTELEMMKNMSEGVRLLTEMDRRVGEGKSGEEVYEGLFVRGVV